jgi:DNA-binding GntR family transcriptional regulator
VTDPVSAAEQAYQHTKDAIIRGELAAGTAISEGLVCERLGISRTPAHEAFLRLAAEGLLALASRKGAIVQPLSPSEAADVLEMREAIEGACAARVIGSGGGPALVPALRELLDRQRAAVDSGDLDAFIEADDALHAAVIDAARNPVAQRFADLLSDRQNRLRNQLIRVSPDQMRGSFAEHTALVDAIEAGDADAYRTTLGRHVDRNRGVL